VVGGGHVELAVAVEIALDNGDWLTAVAAAGPDRDFRRGQEARQRPVFE
jgi:hypothetical protein